MSADNRQVRTPAGQDTGRAGSGRPGGFGRPGGGPGGGHGPGGFGRPVEKAKDFKGTLRRLLGYLKPYRINLVIVIIFAIASTAFAIASPKVQGNAINKLTDGYMAKMLLSEMGKVQRTAADSVKMGASANTMPETGQPFSQLPPEALEAIKEFMSLPMLDTLTNADEKADTVEKMLGLYSKMPEIANVLQKAPDSNAPDSNAPDSNAPDSNAPDSSTSDNGTRVRSEGQPLPGRFTPEQLEAALKAIRETNGRIDFDYILRIVLILIGMYVISSLFLFVTQWVMSGVAQKTSYQLRKDVDNKLAKLPLKYFDSKTHGEILSRVTNDVDTISTTLQQSITQVITSVIQIVGYILMMLITSPMLTLIVLATMPLYVLTTATIAKKSQKYFAAQQKELGELSGHVEEMYTGHKIVKAFGYEKKSAGKFADVNDRLYSAGWKAQFVSGVMFPLMNFISNLGYVLICVFGGMWMTQNRLNLGDITAFIQYSRSFTHPIIQTANIANVIQSTIACAERVFEVLDEQEEIPDSEAAADPGHVRGEVVFENVDFRYMENEPLIQDMNLSLRPGDTIAIVGPTGAGKTTLVNLLMRFYEINGGAIRIDGTDIREIRRNSLRSMFGMVLQDTWLFNGTIRDNIAYGREGASEEDIIEASKAAHADHFIRTLPEGYDTVLNEEATNISQGQKQLLTIARAILADPAILILDEATSSVDTRTELLIQKAMANLMKNRTSFVIAHRLSTIRDAELILVMDHGRIIEQGSHRELLSRNGFYSELYNSQFTGANLGEAV